MNRRKARIGFGIGLCLLFSLAEAGGEDEWELFYEGKVGDGIDEYKVALHETQLFGVRDYTVDDVTGDILLYDGEKNDIKRISSEGRYLRTIPVPVREYWVMKIVASGEDVFLFREDSAIGPSLKHLRPDGSVVDISLRRKMDLYEVTTWGMKGYAHNVVSPYVVGDSLYLLVAGNEWFTLPIGGRSARAEGGWEFLDPEEQEARRRPGRVRSGGLPNVAFNRERVRAEIIDRDGQTLRELGDQESLEEVDAQGNVYTVAVEYRGNEILSWFKVYDPAGMLVKTIPRVRVRSDVAYDKPRTRFGPEGSAYFIQLTEEEVVIWKAATR
ncbi:MAG: hypothetical protein FJY73_00010 [Candidatus Eisenbacteria bacterium]|nr:hypothetical protein [Candidatus Eisenbacteria bacterium]